MKRGTYHYPFQSYLPADLPCSLQGNCGYIRYVAIVVLNIPMQPDQQFEIPFTVVKAINLNASPILSVIDFHSFGTTFECLARFVKMTNQN